MLPGKLGLPKNVWKLVLSLRNTTSDNYDIEVQNQYRGALQHIKIYNKSHPVQDCTIKYNSWGLRDVIDYEQYYKQKVILCIGDSFTVNIAGRFEDSWPKLLQKYFNIPVLNIGITNIGPDSMNALFEKMQQYFDAQHIFSMYNIHGNEWSFITRPISENATEEKLKLLKESIPYKSHIAFVPPWSWGLNRLKVLYEYFPNAHAYLKDIDFKYADIPLSLFSIIIGNEYKKFSNKKWPTIEQIYYQLAKTNDLGDLMDKKDSYFFLRHIYPKCKLYFYTNRDGFHFSRMANQMVADYFYFKSIGLESTTDMKLVKYLAGVNLL